MNRTQLEHIIRAASEIAGDPEIVVIGSQAIHAQDLPLPPVAFLSAEADIYPRSYPERADDIDAAIGELSVFHATHGYYAHGVSPATAVLPLGWEQRLVRLSNANTAGATGLCLDLHDLVLSKFVAGRAKDMEFNTALAQRGHVSKRKLLQRAKGLPVGAEILAVVRARIRAAFPAGGRGSGITALD